MRRLMSKIFLISGSIYICGVVLLYNHLKFIVVSSNRVFDASSIVDLDDSPKSYNPRTGSRSKPLIHKATESNGSLDLPILTKNDTNINGQTDYNTTITEAKTAHKSLRFYILPPPDIHDVLQPVLNKTKSELLDMASEYYKTHLNEESAEMWLHRGFQRLPAATNNKKEADVYVVVGYFHLFNGLLPSSVSWKDEIVPKMYREIVVDISKPHLILIPTWNPSVSRNIGLYSLVETLQMRGVSAAKLWSVGFERNVHWQPVQHVSQILPIPYVMQIEERDDDSRKSKTTTNASGRIENSVFFAGDPRKHAEEWSGCSRPKLIEGLQAKLKNDTGTDLRLLNKKNRMNQTTHQERMQSSEFCLVLCGDTPSSRTLTSAIVEGCIPVRVGSRLRGLCDPPCHPGFGWDVTGPDNPHLPYLERFPWEKFPEINEGDLLRNSGKDVAKRSSLRSMFQNETLETKELYSALDRFRSGFVYGYGDPVVSKDFGDAAAYIWESFVTALQKGKKKR